MVDQIDDSLEDHHWSGPATCLFDIRLWNIQNPDARPAVSTYVEFFENCKALSIARVDGCSGLVKRDEVVRWPGMTDITVCHRWGPAVRVLSAVRGIFEVGLW